MGRAARSVAVALLGACAVVLPASAATEGAPSVSAENVGADTHYWAPSSVSVATGASVSFSNPTNVPHGIRWVSAPGGAPSCTSGVPVEGAAPSSGANWSGSCTFAAPGTYIYYCTVHGAAMSGSVTVGSTATTPTTTSTATTTPYPAPGGQPAGAPPPQGSGAAPVAAASLSALALRAPAHGTLVRGSLLAGAGGRLEVDLLAARALLARTGGSAVVGRSVRTLAHGGSVTFAVGLDGRGRRALRARGRLALTLRARLVPAQGAPVTATRRLLLHR